MSLYICNYSEGLDPFLATGLDGIKEALTDLYGGEYRGYSAMAGGIAVDWRDSMDGDFVVHCMKVEKVYGQNINSRAA